MLRMTENLTAGLGQRYPLFRRLHKLFSGAGLRGDARLANYFLWTKDSHLRSLYSPEFKASLREQVTTQPMLDFLAPLSDSKPDIERMLALEQRFFLADHNLIYTDKMSMAAGVEVRVPFLDLDLLAFAGRIPSCFKQRGTVSKWVLKRAMEPYLPRDVIYRAKTGFGAPLRRWMRHELREMLGDVLSEDSLRQRGIFEPTAVQRLVQKNDTGQIDAAYLLLSLLCVEVWCRRFVDTGKQNCLP
jgi:asparagine synthase (glutamine-hydrolysing)